MRKYEFLFFTRIKKNINYEEKNGHAPDDDEEKENSGEQRRSKEKSHDSGKRRKESRSPARVVKERLT